MLRFTPYRSTHDISKAHLDAKMKNDHRYDAIRNLDDHSESSTEVEDWEAEGQIKPRPRRRKTFWRKLKAYRWMIDTALLLIIFGLVAEKRWQWHRSHRYELAGDISGFAPTCKPVLLDRRLPMLISSSLATNRQLQARSRIRTGERFRVLEQRDPARMAQHSPRYMAPFYSPQTLLTSPKKV